MEWKQRVKSWVVPQPAAAVDAGQPTIEPGMYHYQQPRDDGYMRFHLRVERNGEALLIAGASEAARLSRAGTRVIKRLLEGESAEAIANELPPEVAGRLIAEADQIIAGLGSPSSRFPIFNLSDPVDDQRDAELIAPFQADVVVADITQLRAILQKLWGAGIPHARFLPIAELPEDQLVQAVEWAEDLGMIAGVRATATWLFAPERIARIAAVGTDYLLCPWAVDAGLHARCFGSDDLSALTPAIERVQEFEMTPVLEIPLVAATVDALDDRITQLVDWNIQHAEVFALARPATSEHAERDHAETTDTPLNGLFDGPQLRQIAAWIEEVADERAIQLTWLPPVAVRTAVDPVAAIRQGPRAGGDVTIRVLANGDVLPPRGGNRSAGNLLSTPWSEIWGCSLFRKYRERVEANTRCAECPGLAICAADCPADPAGWSHDEAL